MVVYDDGTYCFVCQKGEPPETFLKRWGTDGRGLPDRPRKDAKKKRSHKRYREWVAPADTYFKVETYYQILHDERSPRHGRLQYLLDRGLFRNTIKEAKLGHTGDSFSIPLWNDGKIHGIRYRLDEQYHEPEFYAQTRYLQEDDQPVLPYRPFKGKGPIVICEGELDCLILGQYGYDTVTTTGGAGSLSLYLGPNFFFGTQWVYVAMDLDEAGDKAYKALCEAWNKTLPKVTWDTGKDLTDYILSIDSLFKKEEIEKRLNAAEDDNYITSSW